MKLPQADKQLLQELCRQQGVNYDKVLRLLETVKEFEFKDRRTGIYETLKEIITSDLKATV